MKKEFRYFFSALMLIFIALKLANMIDWSWWWVFSPAWIPLVLFIAILILRFGTMLYLYKHDEKYRQILDDYFVVKKAERSLADRLKELQEERTKLARLKIEKRFGEKEKADSDNEE